MGTAGTLIKCVSTLILLTASLCFVNGQRITTIQLDGTQYFVSRMNPYSPELNYFLAYQYCRSLGLQLASFETKEKADSITQYLRNAGYNHYDFWTSGNRLGTDMLIWMSSGLPFNATFNYMRSSYNAVGDEPAEKQPGDEDIKVPAVATGRKGRSDGMSEGCVVLRAPEMDWDVDDCAGNKDFICEQTRCYYYNYGSIPVSSSQGVTKVKPTQTTAQPTSSSEFASTTPPGEPSSSPSNLTVNRRATLRPAVPTPTTLPSLLATLMSETDEEDGAAAGQEDDVMENLASRAFPLKEAGANVVYVTAVGVKNTPGGSDASTTGDGWTATTDQI